MNGADSLTDTLLANGIDVCFANPGTSEMHFVAALDRKPAMRCVLGLFEGVATGAADGYARMAGKPAATLLHLGPGLANGLANLHNARRARSPVVNIVGDHASHHLAADAPLTSDIEGLARPMSLFVRKASGPDSVSADAAAAIEAARAAPGGVATLILPADAVWGRAKAPVVRAKPGGRRRVEDAAVRAAAAAVRAGARTMLFLGDDALRAVPLASASRIAAATGARLLAEQANARMERGRGRVAIERLAYRVDLALAGLAGVETAVLVGSKAPVAFFGYPGKPSTMLPPGCRIVTLSAPGEDAADALERLADLAAPGAPTRPTEGAVPDRPTGRLDAAAISAIVAREMPDEAIVCDEAITSGFDFFRFTHGAAPHDFLQLSGGAIGLGLPMTAGAAIACPGRRVIGLQADGSGMYTLQALWTQAREQLDIVTILYANRSYAILRHELAEVGAGKAGANARSMLDLDRPHLDWVKLAAGMSVEAAQASTAEAFADLLRAALRRRGPFLIEALI